MKRDARRPHPGECVGIYRVHPLSRHRSDAERGGSSPAREAGGEVRISHPGFTLLEVLISVAILSLGLSTVYGSSILAARGTAHARWVTTGALLAQCRMTEVEAYLRANGLPEQQKILDDPPDTSFMGSERCCDLPFTCAARVDKIELPQPAEIGTTAGNQILSNTATAAQGSSFAGYGGDGGLGADGATSAIGQLASTMGALGALGSGGATDPATGLLTAGTTTGGAANPLQQMPPLGGMVQQLLGGIYPTIKPLLEGAIRRVTVTVSWNEGSRPYSFDVIEYYTNPGQTMATGDQLNQLLGTGTPGSGAPGASSPATSAPTTNAATH